MKRVGFQRYLKQVRGDRSLRTIATAAEMNFVYLSHLETGRRKNPSLTVLRRLATALGVPYMRLMFEVGYIDEYEGGSTNE